MKKIISLLLLGAMLAAFTACGAGAEPEIVPNFDDFAVVPGENVDMLGHECLIIQDCNDVSNYTPFGYPLDSLYYDIIVQRARDISDKYNCKVVFSGSYGIGSALTSLLQRAYVSGIVPCDMVYCSSSNCNYTMAISGLLFPLTDLSDYIDLSDTSKYGTPNLIECCMSKGVPYGVIPAALPQKLLDACIEPIFIINENIIQQHGLVDPRDLYEQKTWTFEKFDEVSSTYYIAGSGEEIKSFASNTENFVVGYLGGCGMRMTFEDNNSLKVGFLYPPVIDALDAAREYAVKHEGEYSLDPSVSLVNLLLAGNHTMTLNISENIATIAKELDNFGIVPFPVNGTYTQNGEETNFYSAINTLSIFAGVEEPNFTAQIMSDLLEPIEGYESREQMAEFLYTTMFYDMRDVDIYMNMTKKSQFNYYAIGGYGVLTSMFGNFLNMTGAETVAKFATTYDKVIEEHIAPNWFNYVKEATAALED